MILLGEGGLGKSTSLLELCRRLLSNPNAKEGNGKEKIIIPVYIPLELCLMEKDKNRNLLRYIMEDILNHNSGTENDQGVFLSDLGAMLGKRDEYRYVFLLDSVNECSSFPELIGEINKLAMEPAVSIVLASRDRPSVFTDWTCYELKRLDVEYVRKLLAEEKIEDVPEQLLTILTNPFYLKQYLNLAKENKKQLNGLVSRYGLLKQYIDWSINKQIVSFASKKYNCVELIKRVLPELCFKMASNREMSFSCTDEVLCSASTLALWNTERLSMLKDANIQAQWVDEELCEKILRPLGLAVQVDQGRWTFAHELYRDYFAAEYIAGKYWIKDKIKETEKLLELLSRKLPVDVLSFFADFLRDKGCLREELEEINSSISEPEHRSGNELFFLKNFPRRNKRAGDKTAPMRKRVFSRSKRAAWRQNGELQKNLIQLFAENGWVLGSKGQKINLRDRDLSRAFFPFYEMYADFRGSFLNPESFAFPAKPEKKYAFGRGKWLLFPEYLVMFRQNKIRAINTKTGETVYSEEIRMHRYLYLRKHVEPEIMEPEDMELVMMEPEVMFRVDDKRILLLGFAADSKPEFKLTKIASWQALEINMRKVPADLFIDQETHTDQPVNQCFLCADRKLYLYNAWTPDKLHVLDIDRGYCGTIACFSKPQKERLNSNLPEIVFANGDSPFAPEKNSGALVRPDVYSCPQYRRSQGPNVVFLPGNRFAEAQKKDFDPTAYKLLQLEVATKFDRTQENRSVLIDDDRCLAGWYRSPMQQDVVVCQGNDGNIKARVMNVDVDTATAEEKHLAAAGKYQITATNGEVLLKKNDSCYVLTKGSRQDDIHHTMEYLHMKQLMANRTDDTVLDVIADDSCLYCWRNRSVQCLNKTDLSIRWEKVFFSCWIDESKKMRDGSVSIIVRRSDGAVLHFQKKKGNVYRLAEGSALPALQQENPVITSSKKEKNIPFGHKVKGCNFKNVKGLDAQEKKILKAYGAAVDQ